jgi:hypothetical protein
MGKTIFADTSKDGAAECSDANYPFDFHFTQLVVTGQLYAAAPVAGLLKPALETGRERDRGAVVIAQRR